MPPGNAENDADFAVRRHGVERLIRAGVGGREPDLVARGRPREPALFVPALGERLFVAAQVEHRDRSRIVLGEGMVEKRDAIPFGGKAGIADVPGRFVENFVERVLDARAAGDAAHDEQIRPV